jgi:hypothetical protein
MEYMKNFIGGLFKNREDAEMARKALRENGFEEASIHLLECTHEKEAVVLKEKPTIQSIAIAALIGAVILGGIGTVLGLLVGLGMIQLPVLDPSGGQALPFEITWEYTLTSVATGLIFGVATGAILGAATRLVMAQYKTVDTPQKANKGDLMLAVQTNDMRRETQARSTLKEYGAVRFEEFREKWDTEVWSVFEEEASQAG